MNQTDKRTPRKQVAVVGGGVAGIVAAHLLQKTHAVTLLEQGDYLGGHTHTIAIPDGRFRRGLRPVWERRDAQGAYQHSYNFV